LCRVVIVSEAFYEFITVDALVLSFSDQLYDNIVVGGWWHSIVVRPPA